jgi:hypothetical protein
LLTLCLLLASPALAGESDDAERAERKLAQRVFTQTRSIGDPTSSRPTMLHPICGLYAAAYPISSLGFWAEGTGFSLTRRSAIYNLEGGAAWRIDEGIRLTASYRVMGVDFGYDSDVEGADIEPAIAAPFLGIAFDF